MSDGTIFSPPSLGERLWLIRVLREETTGGLLLMAAAVIALAWVNSPWGDSYLALSAVTVGPAALHLNLSLSDWAADGLLAVFFFLAGLELKHEFVHGTLSRPAQAIVPIGAALGGMIVPALLFTVIAARSGQSGALVGWGVPMATDIAFALAVLAIVGRRLPLALRAFLLTLAVVDDLGAITVIAVFYSSGFVVWYFLGALATFGVYAVLQRRRVTSPWIYVPLVLLSWYLMHASGIHATVTGVVLGLLTRATADPGEGEPPADRLQRRLLPLSAAVCVPIFAFFAAGVDLRGTSLRDVVATGVGIGVLVGLVVGKPIGVVGTSWMLARFTKARLDPSIGWADVMAIGLLAGIGFTVALLIAELAFTGAPLASAKVAVLLGSVIAALLASCVLLLRNRHYARTELTQTEPG